MLNSVLKTSTLTTLQHIIYLSFKVVGSEYMDKNKHLGIIVDPELHGKLKYIAQYEGRSNNGQILYLIRQCIAAFEKEHGEIDWEEKNN